MKKFYPNMIAAGIPVTICVENHWDTATVSIYVSHRKGQKAKAELSVQADGEDIITIWQDFYKNYLAIRFEINVANFSNPLDAALECASYVNSISKYINFDASTPLVTKELLTALVL